ncbi:transcriptional regulator [Spirochaetia bacterium]|nr:transcriptional regulator [Spirochaetia bacterium]
MLFGCMIFSMGFKENLKSELSYRDMRVKELAALAGISKHTLDNYLNVRGYMPSADVAVKIAKVLEVSVEYLVTGENEQQDKTPLGPEVRTLVQNFKQLDKNDRQMILAIVQLFYSKSLGTGEGGTIPRGIKV